MVRAVMLKGATFDTVANHFAALILFVLALACIALLRFRRTLD
jgi:ABC-2 type transport system permease protein